MGLTEDFSVWTNVDEHGVGSQYTPARYPHPGLKSSTVNIEEIREEVVLINEVEAMQLRTGCDLSDVSDIEHGDKFRIPATTGDDYVVIGLEKFRSGWVDIILVEDDA